METHGAGVKLTVTDRLGMFADRWWPVAIITFGGIAFLAVLPHKYIYHW